MFNKNNSLIEKQDDVFFSPGDTVEIRQAVSNKPIMIVKSVDRLSTVHEKPKLLGITCFWFDAEQKLQSARFSTKDLVHIQK